MSEKRHRSVFTDPATGDPLSLGEELSFQAQKVIRRWTFLGLVTGVTIVVWAAGDPRALTWWNLSASYLALVIESVVGIGMFSMSRRDAVVMRETREMARRVVALGEAAAEAAQRRAEADEKRDVMLAHLEDLASRPALGGGSGG